MPEPEGSAIPVLMISKWQNEFDGGYFAGAVGPDKPHNISFWQGKAELMELETVKGFRQIFYL